jgi:uncharacterized protein YqhQ
MSLRSPRKGVGPDAASSRPPRRRLLSLLAALAEGGPMYGGQAVIEGVMMRSPGFWSLAVRKPNGELAELWRPIDSVMKRHRLWRLPFVRGVIALGESLAIGFRALAASTRYAAEGEDGEEGVELGPWAIAAMFAFAIIFALGLFKVGPGLLTSLLPVSGGWFVIVEGAIRVTVLVLYLALISLMPDLRRVFAYHGAEHKTINAYEAGEELDPDHVAPYSVIHPRCGTAFLLWVMVIAIFVFAAFGRPSILWLVITRIVFLPVIAGIAYELIRFAGKHRKNVVLKALLAPGLWLQRLTTREPSADQLEVAIAAFKRVYELENEGVPAGEPAPVARRIDVMA